MEGEENETRLCHDVGATTQNTDSFFSCYYYDQLVVLFGIIFDFFANDRGKQG